MSWDFLLVVGKDRNGGTGVQDGHRGSEDDEVCVSGGMTRTLCPCEG